MGVDFLYLFIVGCGLWARLASLASVDVDVDVGFRSYSFSTSVLSNIFGSFIFLERSKRQGFATHSVHRVGGYMLESYGS